MSNLVVVTLENYEENRYVVVERDRIKQGTWYESLDFFNATKEELERLEDLEMDITDLGDYISKANESYVSAEELHEAAKDYKYVRNISDIMESEVVNHWEDEECYLEHWNGSNYECITVEYDEDNALEIEYVTNSKYKWNQEIGVNGEYEEYRTGQWDVYKDNNNNYYIFNNSYYQGSLIESEELKKYTEEEIEKILDIKL